MKSFKKQLEIMKENGCSICDIIIAGSAEACYNFAYTDEEFEKLCGVALEAYLSSEDVSEDDINYAIDTLIAHGFSVNDVCEMSKWDLLEYAVDGIPADLLKEDDDCPWCEGWTGIEDCEECEMHECNCNPLYGEDYE